MDPLAPPLISIIMPVYNTGKYLTEAIKSVLNQQPVPDCAVPSFELIVVDDHSTDAKTLEILSDASRSDPRIHIIVNQRQKGAAGARNTGIINSRGAWIGFLDSDDIWFPNSLALRWRCILGNANVRWTAAKFRLLKPTKIFNEMPVFPSIKDLIAGFDQYKSAPEVICMKRPVKEFGESCMIQTTTVLLERVLIMEKGLFNEQLLRAEDYHLWFKCAFDTDLWMTQAEVSFYRIHSDSLTHGNTPKYLYEDAMIELLLEDPVGSKHKTLLNKRYDFVMQDHLYFYRQQRFFSTALKTSWQWINKKPFNPSAWKELIACFLRIG